MPPVTARTFPGLSLPSSPAFHPFTWFLRFQIHPESQLRLLITPFLTLLGSTVLSTCLSPLQPQPSVCALARADGSPPVLARVCAELP